MGKKKIKFPEVTSHSGGVGLSKNQYENQNDDGTPTFCFKHLLEGIPKLRHLF